MEEINLGPRKWIVRTTNGLSAIFSPLFLAACPNRVKCLFYPSPSLSHSQHPNCPILIFMTLLFLRGFQKFCRRFHLLIPYPYISFRAPGFDTTVCFGSLSSANPSLTYICSDTPTPWQGWCHFRRLEVLHAYKAKVVICSYIWPL